jgi:hypothetical protein
MIHLPRHLGRLAALLLTVVLIAACGADDGSPSASSPVAGLPTPTCGGLKIQIDPALPCDRVAEIAVAALRDRAPQQLDRGVSAIDVVLSECPRREVPPQITCGPAKFVQMVTVTFGPAGSSGLIEPSLTVAVEPTTGAILGISNPLIR